MSETKQAVLDAAVKFIQKHGVYPTVSDMLKLDVSRKTIDYHFGNISALKAEACKVCPNVIFDLEQNDYVKTVKKTTKRFVITTAVLGGKVDTKFHNSIKSYLNQHSAELIVIPATDNLSKTGWLLDPLLQKDVIITEDLLLNANLFILGIQCRARTADPITGLPRIGQRNGTFISASPKQRLKYVPTSLDKLPHALMSTGAITKPGYSHSGIMSDKSTYVANHDHVMGAIIVELDKDDTFHFRQIQADAKGAFIDLGVMYEGNKRRKVRPEAIIPGDWHSGDTDPMVVECLKRLTKQTNPKRWVMHDLFDGLSVNPYIVGKNITLAKMHEAGKTSLRNELNFLALEVKMMSKLVDEVVIVASNHDDFVNRYLEKGGYIEDKENKIVALELAMYLAEGKNPLEAYIGRMSNVKWLKLDQSYMLGGTECGMHGHLGANGAKGTINTMENAYGAVMYGHTHSGQILREAWNVGTSTYLKLGYNKGSSSWTQTAGIIYPNGQKQLINFINGKYGN